MVNPVYVFATVMGHVLSNGLELTGTGTNIWKDENLKQSIENMIKLAEKDTSITERERKHASAIQAWSKGYNFSESFCIIFS